MEFQLVQNRAAHENTAFLGAVSCCNAGTLVEMQCWDACGDAVLDTSGDAVLDTSGDAVLGCFGDTRF